MRFESTDSYIVTDELALAVDAAIKLERPLLIKGEPGTGKTLLAEEVARSMGMPLLTWHIKSTTKAQQGLYEYDAVSRLRDSQLGDERVNDIRNYIKKGKLWEAFEAGERSVLLIDEIDKADTDFQDDMLDVLDQMSFDIMEIDKTVQAKHRPVIIITSNAKKDLSEPFLGRCNFHHIAFPEPDMMRSIVQVHFPEISDELLEHAVNVFYSMRQLRGVEKKPATRELINWIRALKSDPDFKPKQLKKGNFPYLGVLFKKSGDLHVAKNSIDRIRC
jgi:MoxR-like ATPase